MGNYVLIIFKEIYKQRCQRQHFLDEAHAHRGGQRCWCSFWFRLCPRMYLVQTLCRLAFSDIRVVLARVTCLRFCFPSRSNKIDTSPLVSLFYCHACVNDRDLRRRGYASFGARQQYHRRGVNRSGLAVGILTNDPLMGKLR